MAYYEGELKSGFRIREIFEEISLIGWKNLIKWYITIGILYLILIIIASTIRTYISIINPILGGLIMLLFILPYSYIFLARSIALFYIHEKMRHNSIIFLFLFLFLKLQNLPLWQYPRLTL